MHFAERRDFVLGQIPCYAEGKGTDDFNLISLTGTFVHHTGMQTMEYASSKRKCTIFMEHHPINSFHFRCFCVEYKAACLIRKHVEYLLSFEGLQTGNFYLF